MEKKIRINYDLHPPQRQVFKDPSRFVILAAGRRFGKTTLALVEILAASISQEKSRCWYIAPTYRQAEMIAWKMLLEMIPKEAILKKNEVKLEIILANGSEIALKGADNEDALRGTGLHFVVLDEYGMMKPNVWEEIIRPSLTDTLGRALFIGTPKGKNHFFNLFLKGERKETNYSSYRFKTEDNPYISRLEVKEAESQLNARYFRQEYEASFEDYTGLVWPEFSQEKHVLDPFEIEKGWETIGVIDPAMSGTTGSLFSSVDYDGNLIIWGEYYERDKRVSEVCESIKDKSNFWIGDPAGSHKGIFREGKLYSLYDEYLDNGIMVNPGENDVDAGINRVAEYFKSGKIKIFSTCKNLIYELERYHWSEESETALGISKPKPYKSLDHLADCIRYLVMSRPGIPKKKEEIKVNTMAYFEALAESKRELQQVLEEYGE